MEEVLIEISKGLVSNVVTTSNVHVTIIDHDNLRNGQVDEDFTYPSTEEQVSSERIDEIIDKELAHYGLARKKA